MPSLENHEPQAPLANVEDGNSDLEKALVELATLMADADDIGRYIDRAALDGDGATILALRRRRDELASLIPAATVRLARAEVVRMERDMASLTAQIPAADRGADEARAVWEAAVEVGRQADERFQRARGEAMALRSRVDELQQLIGTQAARMREAMAAAAR